MTQFFIKILNSACPTQLPTVTDISVRGRTKESHHSCLDGCLFQIGAGTREISQNASLPEVAELNVLEGPLSLTHSRNPSG